MDKHKGVQRKALRLPFQICIKCTAQEALSDNSYIYDQEEVNSQTTQLKAD